MHILTCISIIYIRSAPEYYESIKQPIDLLKIQQKLKTEEYDEIEQLTEDVQLLVKNAKSYYQVRVRVCVRGPGLAVTAVVQTPYSISSSKTK